MTASQQPTGHDKAAQAVAATIRNSLDLRGIELTWSDVRAAASAAVDVLRAHDRAALAAGDPDVAEALGGKIDERFSPRFVDDGPCNGRCQTVACDDSHRGHRLEWRNLRRFVTDWTDAP